MSVEVLDMGTRFVPGGPLTVANRRRVVTRSLQLGASVAAVGATGGLTSILASAKAPVYFQDAKPSGKARLLYYGDAANEEARFAEFSKVYPDIEIEVVGIPGGTWADFADAVTTRIAGGEKFDVLVIATEGQRLFASLGLISPIDDLLERDAGEMKDFYDDVNPNMLEWCKTLSLPCRPFRPSQYSPSRRPGTISSPPISFSPPRTK